MKRRRAADTTRSAIAKARTSPPELATWLSANQATPGHATASIAASQRRPGQYGASGGGARANNTHIQISMEAGDVLPPAPIVQLAGGRSAAGNHRVPRSRPAAV